MELELRLSTESREKSICCWHCPLCCLVVVDTWQLFVGAAVIVVIL